MEKRQKLSFPVLNTLQRKELARVSFDVAKTIFLTAVAGYFLPPLIGFKETIGISAALKGGLGSLTFVLLGVKLLEEVKEK